MSNRDDFGTLLAVYALMIELSPTTSVSNVYLPNALSILLPARLLYMNPLEQAVVADRPEDFVHPAVDRRICVIAGCPVRRQNGVNSTQDGLPPPVITNGGVKNAADLMPSNGSARIFPRVFGNKRLEGILARLDDDKIDAALVMNIDEGNPQIILDYLIEANKCHSLSAFLSEDDIFVILKYFNDFLARNYSASTFHRYITRFRYIFFIYLLV